MAVHLQGFSVRFADTVNRFGASCFERTGATSPHGELALVILGGRSLVARTHGERVTRRGRQTLVSVHGRLTWVASQRVQILEYNAA